LFFKHYLLRFFNYYDKICTKIIYECKQLKINILNVGGCQASFQYLENLVLIGKAGFQLDSLLGKTLIF